MSKLRLGVVLLALCQAASFSHACEPETKRVRVATEAEIEQERVERDIITGLCSDKPQVFPDGSASPSLREMALGLYGAMPFSTLKNLINRNNYYATMLLQMFHTTPRRSVPALAHIVSTASGNVFRCLLDIGFPSLQQRSVRVKGVMKFALPYMRAFFFMYGELSKFFSPSSAALGRLQEWASTVVASPRDKLESIVRLSEKLRPELVARALLPFAVSALEYQVVDGVWQLFENELHAWADAADDEAQERMRARLLDYTHRVTLFHAERDELKRPGVMVNYFYGLLKMPKERLSDFDLILNQSLGSRNDADFLQYLPHILSLLPQENYQNDLALVKLMFLNNVQFMRGRHVELDLDWTKVSQDQLLQALYFAAGFYIEKGKMAAFLDANHNLTAAARQINLVHLGRNLWSSREMLTVFEAVLRVPSRLILEQTAIYIDQLPQLYRFEPTTFQETMKAMNRFVVDKQFNVQQLGALTMAAAELCKNELSQEYTEDERFLINLGLPSVVLYRLAEGNIQLYQQLLPYAAEIQQLFIRAERAAKILALLSKLPEQHAGAMLKDVMRLVNQINEDEELQENEELLYHDLDQLLPVLINGHPDGWKNVIEFFSHIIETKVLFEEEKLNAIMMHIGLFPASCRLTLDEVDELVESDDKLRLVLNKKKFAKAMRAKYLALNEEGKNAVWQYWREILQSNNQLLARKLADYMIDNRAALRLTEDDDFLALAYYLRGLVERNNSRSPYAIYAQLKDKKKATVDWGLLPVVQGQVDGVQGVLCPSEIGPFGLSIVMDFESVPAFSADQFSPILEAFKQALIASRSAIAPALANTMVCNLKVDANTPLILQVAMVLRELKSVKAADGAEGFVIEGDHMTVSAYLAMKEKQHGEMEKVVERVGKNLLKRIDLPATDMAAAKMKCILKHMADSYQGEARNARLCELLMAWRFCQTGQNLSLEEFYAGLSVSYKIKTESGRSLEVNGGQYPAMKLIHGALQDVINRRFEANDPFIRELCGLKSGEEYSEMAHPIMCARGMIGDKVGLCDARLTFDVYGEYIKDKMLKAGLQEMLQVFYKHTDFTRFVQQTQQAMNRLISQSDSRDELNKALTAVHTAMKVGEDYESWLTFPNEESFDWNGLSVLGTLRLLQRAGVVRLM